jgi:TolA-binding protein
MPTAWGRKAESRLGVEFRLNAESEFNAESGRSAESRLSLLRRPVVLAVSLVVLAILVLAGGGSLAHAAGVDTNPMNYDPAVREAFQHFHDLDYAGAVERFERYHAAHPGDTQATAYLLNAVIFQELYREDLLDTTFYANDGFLSGHHAIQEDPQARDRIFALADEAVREADWRLSKNPNDVNALFARAWVRSLRCAYVAMAERSFSAGFHLANKAKDDAQRVLQLDPNYVDAKLILGVYQYVVGALPWPFKLMIGFVGITGSKSTGMALLRDAGSRGVITSVEARTAMALFLRRDGKYEEAIQVVHGLESEYPRNFLFRLEEANLRKDAGQGMDAVDAYRRLLADNAKPGYFASAKVELADFGLGDALRGQRRYTDAAQAYEQAAATPGAGAELRIRSLLDAGECRDLLDQRAEAVKDYQAAVEAGPGTSRADTARKYLRSAYRGN